MTALRCYRELKDAKRLERSLGTLGGGNHFIEIDEASDGTKYLIIHSGSRNLGKHDVVICQAFALRSRERMAEIILERTGMTGGGAFHTIHNYIDTEEMILRKGAIAAHSGEKVLIPALLKEQTQTEKAKHLYDIVIF